MPDLVIDVSRLVGRRFKRRLPTGIDRVGLAYVRHYRQSARAALSIGSRSLVLPPRESDRLFEHLLSHDDERSFLRTAIAAAIRAPIAADTVDSWFLNTGHTGLHRAGYEAMIASAKVKPLYVVHDLIPITHPQYCRAPEASLHAERMTRAIRSGAAIVCNSHATFESLSAFAATRGLTVPPATVAPLGTDPLPGAVATAARAEAPIAGPYFLMLGTIEPRKNHLLMLQVWQRLRETLGPSAPKLVLVGQAGWECEHVHRMLDRTPALRSHVIRPGRCDDAQLHRWIAHARALLFPSFAEGFGLPLVEALQWGLPVLASDLPVFREVAQDLPEYLDPLDSAGWLQAVLDYSAPGHRRRERRIEAIRDFAAPTWADHFAKVDALMSRIDVARSASRQPREPAAPARRAPAGGPIDAPSAKPLHDA
ncbi:MAG: glycosyltransferase family 4 protein [Lautropia sp.]